MRTRVMVRIRRPRVCGVIGLGLAATVLTAGCVPYAEAASGTAGTVTFVEGQASVVRGDKGSPVSLATNTKIGQGDRLKTGSGARLEAKLNDGSLLRLAENSELRLDSAAIDRKNPGKKKVKAKLFVGRVWAAVTKLFGDDSEFEVQTPNAVAGVRGTRFAAAAGSDGSTTVKVYSGQVLVSNKPIYAVKGHTKANRVQVAGPQEISKNQWDELVAGAMQMVKIAASGEMTKAEQFAMAQDGADDWEAWNSERDKVAGIKE